MAYAKEKYYDVNTFIINALRHVIKFQFNQKTFQVNILQAQNDLIELFLSAKQ